MFKHLFKLILNKKKENFLLILEMLISFMVMFVVFTLLVFCYYNYLQRMGFDYENVWTVSFSPPENIKRPDSVEMFHDALKKRLLSMPQIKAVSFCGSNVPFAMSTHNTRLSTKNNLDIESYVYNVEDSYKDVLNLHVLEGRWLSNADLPSSKYIPAVISKNLKEQFFGQDNAIGKIIGEPDFNSTKGASVDRYRVVGVVDNIKDKGEYHAIENGLYVLLDTVWYNWTGNMVIKVTSDVDAAFEGKLFKTLSNTIGTSLEIEHLDKKLVSINKVMLVPLIITSIIAGFLIFNVALGLFGVLWYNINKRKAEIGLRRAVGATGSAVSRQLVSESLVLSTLSLIVGFFFAVQFPLLNVFDLSASIYVTAIVLAIIFIYLLVFICSVYPSKQAAAIYPATALHED
jgi:putative ABC transport system permease protein